jgi:cytochrome P450
MIEVIMACLSFAVFAGVAIAVVQLWYTRLVRTAQQQVHHIDGRLVPMERPAFLLGNLPSVYRAPNRLDAYNAFHTRFGEIVRIFWMWRPQLSVSAYGMAMRILAGNQRNYPKRTPNVVLQRLFGLSVLSENGEAWKRNRSLIGDTFSARRVTLFHDLFVSEANRLRDKWDQRLAAAGSAERIDILPDITAMCLDIIGRAVLGSDFGAQDGRADDFVSALNYIVEQSTWPVHAIAPWWRHLPLKSNIRLKRSFRIVDDCLTRMIRDRRPAASNPPSNLLDSLLAAASHDNAPLTDREVRDNLLAIIVNGYQTVAVAIAMTLDLLARNRDRSAVAVSEIDRALVSLGGKISVSAIRSLKYLDAAIQESLRVCPPVAGFQRIADHSDVLDGWCIPPGEVIGISLGPLHADAARFGHTPEQFRPERYLGAQHTEDAVAPEAPSRACPFTGVRVQSAVHPPLTFGAGARRCLGEHFALYEMKVALAILLHRFDYDAGERAPVKMELEKFGLFLSARPETGVVLAVSRRFLSGSEKSAELAEYRGTVLPSVCRKN